MTEKDKIVSEIFQHLVKTNYHAMLLKGGHSIIVMEADADYEIKITKKKERATSTQFQQAEAFSHI